MDKRDTNSFRLSNDFDNMCTLCEPRYEVKQKVNTNNRSTSSDHSQRSVARLRKRNESGSVTQKQHDNRGKTSSEPLASRLYLPGIIKY